MFITSVVNMIYLVISLHNLIFKNRPLAHRGMDMGSMQAKERSLRRNQPFWHLDLGLPASRTVKKCICVKCKNKTGMQNYWKSVLLNQFELDSAYSCPHPHGQ